MSERLKHRALFVQYSPWTLTLPLLADYYMFYSSPVGRVSFNKELNSKNKALLNYHALSERLPNKEKASLRKI